LAIEQSLSSPILNISAFMKFALKLVGFTACMAWSATASAQDDAFPDYSTMPAPGTSAPASRPATTTTTSTPRPATPNTGGGGNKVPSNVKIEALRTNGGAPKPDADAPLDGIVQKSTILEKQTLPYEGIREADIMWEKRVWRVLDVREKMNLPFSYPEEPFITIVMDGVKDSTLRAYSIEDDKFHHRLSAREVMTLGSSIDTIPYFDPNTFEQKYRVVENKMDAESVKRFRMKEVWFFDKEASVFKVRILGIAPLKDQTDEAGNFLYEQPLFWIYYPDCREYFGKHRVFADNNDANPTSWEDLFEQRRFSSYIFKESNVYDRRLQQYLSGIDILLEGEKIKQDIFNYEHDLWSY
jgi:gliding motility associated protien GldN